MIKISDRFAGISCVILLDFVFPEKNALGYWEGIAKFVTKRQFKKAKEKSILMIPVDIRAAINKTLVTGKAYFKDFNIKETPIEKYYNISFIGTGKPKFTQSRVDVMG